jgi:ribosomal protein S18 acetylase RimI-like enzyme
VAAVSYRPLVASDREFCVRVHHLSMRAYVEPLWGWNDAVQDALALEFLQHRNATHELAIVSETPVGYLSYQNATDALFLNKLHLHPDHQGRGHGSEIMLRLIGMARSTGKPIELSVLTTNPRARSFYERHGFLTIAANTEKIRMRRSETMPHPTR